MIEKNKKFVLKNIKSNFVLKKIFNNLPEKKVLNIIHYNKYIQNRINKDKNYFRGYSTIVIEVKLELKKQRDFIIHVLDRNEQFNYHIYLNDNKKELKRIQITKNDNAETAKIIIEPEVNSFAGLFKTCCIKFEVDI